MITMEIFLMGLTICATLSGLVTEATKKTFKALDQKLGSTALAAICSIVVAVAACVVYIIYMKVVVTAQVLASIVVFVILSWIGATVGYDKVKQAIGSFGKKQ